MIGQAAKVYLALGAVVLIIWWAWNNQTIDPNVTETAGSVGTGTVGT
jgi:hypothetical protein